jgi:DNA repair exonuclease SbcCD ATPase subunit
MVKFECISIKNFLTYGNSPVTYNFNKGKVAVITGKNESGKSSIISALYFALTGKPYQDINKGDLVNNVNKKDCLVELSFSVNSIDYLIKRGIKPNLFEIYKDKVKIDEESHTKDYQEVLESITGLTPAIIKQILIISNRFYTPFLELSAADKREFIETILGITLLSEMSDNIKKRLTNIKQDELLISKDIERVESNIEIVKEFVEKDSLNSDGRKEEVLKQIDTIKNEIVLIKNDLVLLESDKQKHNERRTELKKYTDYKNKVETSLSDIKSEINRVMKDIRFYSSTINCPTCGGEILNSEEKISEANKLLESLNEKKEVAEKRMQKVTNAENADMEIQDILSKLRMQISKNEILISNKTEKINDLKAELNKVIEIGNDNNQKLISLSNELEDKISDRIVLTKDKKNVTMVQKLISDKGIKKYILNKYIPILNKSVNDYLEILQAKYRIIFDEELNDKLLGKGYENLSYSSLSSGAKQRYDLALMFSFIEIAKMKNNVNCNVICFDETMSDIDNLEGVGKVFDKLKENDYSVNLITHDDRLKELGDINYKVSKSKFTQLECDASEITI